MDGHVNMPVGHVLMLLCVEGSVCTVLYIHIVSPSVSLVSLSLSLPLSLSTQRAHFLALSLPPSLPLILQRRNHRAILPDYLSIHLSIYLSCPLKLAHTLALSLSPSLPLISATGKVPSHAPQAGPKSHRTACERACVVCVHKVTRALARAHAYTAAAAP